MRILAHVFCLAAASCGALFAAPARASDAKERATALFKEGREAMEVNDFEKACPLFEQSLSLDPAAGTRLNLAVCEQSRGRLASALAHFRAVAPVFPPNDERRAFANEQVDALLKRVAKLKIELDGGAPPGIAVSRDGALVHANEIGAFVTIDPGAHVVEASASGYEPRRYEVTLAEGESKAIAIEPMKAARPPREARPLFGVRSIVGFVVGGVGVASLGAGIATGVMVLDRKSIVDASCHGTSVCDDQAGIDASEEGATLSIVSTTTFIVGLAAIGAGVTLIATDDRGEAPVDAALLATPLPGGGGLALRGTLP